MTAMLHAIKGMYQRGDTGEFSHMIVLHNTVDFENYAVYVKHGADPRQVARDLKDDVDECYAYALGWESQSKERRANHWEMDLTAPEPEVHEPSMAPSHQTVMWALALEDEREPGFILTPTCMEQEYGEEARRVLRVLHILGRLTQQT